MLTPALQTEYEALTRACGCALLPRTLIEVRGNDRTRFLNSFCTNDVKRLTPGQGCEAFVTSHQGKTIGHVFIDCEPDRLMVDTVPGQAQSLIAHFDKFVISEDVQFRDLSVETTNFVVAGPQAAERLHSLTGANIPAEPCSFLLASIAGCEVAVRRMDYAGPNAYFVQTPAAESEKVCSALTAAGAVPCSEAAVEILRLEAGFPRFGLDITEDNLPQEVNRDTQAISFKKGCYLGQETVARIDALGHVNRVLAGVQFAGAAVPTSGTPLLASGKEIGRVTSATWSHRLQSPLALAYVRRAQSTPGTKLESTLGPAEVVALPL